MQLNFIVMIYRFMRVIVFFDLPTEKESDRRAYRKFRGFLVKNGFVMMQESVYSKIALNYTGVYKIIDEIKKNNPGRGSVEVLTVTEKQFSKMEIIAGECKKDNIIDSDERLIIL